jgi:hypothetical protein
LMSPLQSSTFANWYCEIDCSITIRPAFL